MDANVVDVFLQYGAIGAILVATLIFAKQSIKREQDRADRQEAEVKRLNDLLVDKTIPALVAATQAIQASQAIVQRLQYMRDIEMEARKKKGTSYEE